MLHATLQLTRVHVLVGTLTLAGGMLTACTDDVPSPIAPPSHASASKGGTAGKPGSGEAVLFTGETSGNFDIYLMNPDGTGLRRVTTDSVAEHTPDFAPDNRRFVYVREVGAGKSELFTSYTDGSKPMQLTTLGASVAHPRFSPDGTKIVFSALLAAIRSELFVVNADGTGLKRLTYDQDDDSQPTWSPDGQTIAWVTDREAQPSIYVMNADGLNVRPLVTGCLSGCFDPAFSPDGHRLAYVNFADSVVWVIDLDGENKPVTVGPLGAGETSSPAWSKDGNQVLFSSNRGIEGSSELYAGRPGVLDAASVRRLTVFSPGSANEPAYSR